MAASRKQKTREPEYPSGFSQSHRFTVDELSSVFRDGIIKLGNPRVPLHGFILEGIDTSERPRFSVGETAKFFFARSHQWLRHVERQGHISLDGEVFRSRRTEHGARFYTLNDIELIAHGLAEHGAISGIHLLRILSLVEICARMYGYLDLEEELE